MDALKRIARHVRISWQNLSIPRLSTPPFLVFFISSICNLRCDHCFYWKNLNRRDDLTINEIFTLSDELGRIENLNLSGGEPFLREEFAGICRYFIQNNHVEQIYVPTNAYFATRTVEAISEVLREDTLKLFAVEISFDGMPEYHNRLRGSDRSFQKALETYDALVKLQEQDSRLRIHVVSTVHAQNIDEVKRLTTFLWQRCPAMDHHNIALIRGDRKNPSLQGPDLLAYEKLHAYTQRLWAHREKGRYGSVVEPMLQWAKVRTAKEQKQIVPCRAGILSGVVYANGDVSFCETLPPLGNLRQKSFKEIWHSQEATALRRSIRNRVCYCTNEVFLWPSIVFQPLYLTWVMKKAQAWKHPEPFPKDEEAIMLATE